MAIKQFGIFLTKNSQYFDDIAKMDVPIRQGTGSAGNESPTKRS